MREPEWDEVAMDAREGMVATLKADRAKSHSINRPECISAHGNLLLPGSSDSPASASQVHPIQLSNIKLLKQALLYSEALYKLKLDKF
ncbi:hypothetical protein AAY473_017209 [Plecturocebus cupreus]